MGKLKPTVLTVVLLCLPIGAFGHDIAVQTFTERGSDATVFSLARSTDPVARAMREQFMLAMAQGEEIGIGVRQSAAAPMADMPGRCFPAVYAPAWWLKPDVEVRRAAYFGIMARIACEFGISANLLDALIAQESGYQPMAASRAGAMGMMQIMPGTAVQLGLGQPWDPVANMRAGARYLRQQIDRFDRVDLALAAYNAGPERRSLRAGHIPAIPETRHYVRTITTNWARLAQLGVEFADAKIRGDAAMMAVNASGYRGVDLIRYDGLTPSNPR